MEMTPKEIKKVLLSLKPKEDIVEIKFRDYEDPAFAVVEKIDNDGVIFCTGTGEIPEDFMLRYSVDGKPLNAHSLQPQVKRSIEIVKIKKVKSKMLIHILNEYQGNLKKRAKELKQEGKDFFGVIRG